MGKDTRQGDVCGLDLVRMALIDRNEFRPKPRPMIATRGWDTVLGFLVIWVFQQIETRSHPA